MANRKDGAKRKRTIKPGTIEALTRSFAESLAPEYTGSAFSWRGAFVDMAMTMVYCQLGLGWFKIHPRHIDDIERAAFCIAEVMAEKDQARADCHACASRVVHSHGDPRPQLEVWLRGETNDHQ